MSKCNLFYDFQPKGFIYNSTLTLCRGNLLRNMKGSKDFQQFGTI